MAALDLGVVLEEMGVTEALEVVVTGAKVLDEVVVALEVFTELEVAESEPPVWEGGGGGLLRMVLANAA